MNDRATVDFDHHDQAWLDDRHAHWARMRATCPVAFNEHFGGFWVVSGYEEVAAASRDDETFSSRFHSAPVDGVQYLGITGIPRPKGIPPVGIAESDGALHQALRRAVNPFMLPPAVEALRPFMRAVTTWFLDQRIEHGSMDLVLDLANPVPAVATMKLIGLQCDSWEQYGELFHSTAAYGPSAPEHRRAIALVGEMVASLLSEANGRRTHPREDLLTTLVEMEVEDEGRRLADDEITAVLFNLVGGGLDTTTSLTSLTLHHLDAHPELRDDLISRPELLLSATEEFLRFFSVSESLTRTVTRDCALGGQQLHRGDYLLLSWLSANRDQSEFADADRVVLERQPNRHLAFGLGAHRCIGMHIARALFQVMIAEVLERIPDYSVDREATRFYEGHPEHFGVVRMPITFTPRPRTGPGARPF